MVLRRLTIYAIGLSTFLLATEFALRWLEIPGYLLPVPSDVAIAAKENAALLIKSTAVTTMEALVGFVLGNCGAYGLALMLTRWPRYSDLGFGLAVAVKAIPIVALAPLFIIWFGNGLLGKVLLSALICFFPMLVNAWQGLRAIDPDIHLYAQTLGLNQTSLMIDVRIPTSVLFVLPALKTSSTIAIVGAVVAELSGADAGIGFIMLISIYNLNTSLMFAAIVAISSVGIGFYYLVAWIEKRVIASGFGGGLRNEKQ